MASCESNLYPNVSFSSLQRVKAVPIVTLVRSLALSASLFLFFASSDIVFFCFFGAFSMMNTDETSLASRLYCSCERGLALYDIA